MQNSLSELSEIRRLMSGGQLAEAERLCRQTLKLNPQLAEAWFLFAQVALAFTQVSDALHCVQQACRLEPHHQHYLILQAHILFEIGDAAAAYQLLKPVMTPEQPVSVQQLFGRASWRAGYFNDALKGFAVCAATSPVSEAYILPYARALAGLGERKQLAQQLNSVQGTPGFGAELALLSLHVKLEDEPIAHVLEQALQYGKAFPQHKGIGQFAALLATWQGDLQFSAECFAQYYQRQSLQYVFAVRDKHTKLAGLPTDVLQHAATHASQGGLWLEFGVCFGRSINLLAKFRQGDMHGFDSFQGLPEDWKPGEPKGSYSTGGRLPAVANNVQLHTGWFEHSLPDFLARYQGPVSLVHIDCDLYSSTRTVLSLLADRLTVGSVIVFDDFLGFDSFEQHEFKAFLEFNAQYGFHFRLLSYAALSREVAFQLVSLRQSWVAK